MKKKFFRKVLENLQTRKQLTAFERNAVKSYADERHPVHKPVSFCQGACIKYMGDKSVIINCRSIIFKAHASMWQKYD